MSIPEPTEEEMRDALGLTQVPERLIVGGFKVVYRMVANDGTSEALKAIHIPAAGTEEEEILRSQLIARAQREVEALGSCRSRHLVKLGSIPAAITNVGGEDYLVYSEELLQGESLDNWLTSGRVVPCNELYRVFRTLLVLVRELTHLGYLHRDLKPANIMDTGGGDRRFVVLDLGVAYKVHGTDLSRGAGPPGTLRYMAPELLRPDYKDVMDFRCDLYSAALTVYVLATGVHPFAPRPESPYHTMYRIMNDRPTPLHNVRNDLPAKFCQIIDRCLRKKPALRYASLDLVEKELQEVAP